MCNPAVIPYVIMAAGTALQYRAQEQREDDMRGLQRRETERADAHYDESKKLLDRNQSTYERDDVEAGMAKASAGRQAQYAAADRAAPQAAESLPGAKSTNSVVADAFARALSGAKADADKQGAARADLASFGDFMGDASIENNRRSTEIGQIGGFTMDSANVLPLELQYAATRNRSSATLGNLMAAFGSAMAGGMGGGGGGNSLVGPQTVGTTMTGAQANNLFGGFT